MRNLRTLLSGVVLGFVLAHFVNQTAWGSKFFARVNQAVAEMREAVVTGYNEAE